MNDGKNIFLAFEGGYFGPSYYYYINSRLYNLILLIYNIWGDIFEKIL